MYRQLTKDIRAGKIAPVYLFYGEERFLLNQVLAELQLVIAPEGDSSFNYDRFDGVTADPGEVVNAANMLPFFAERKLIVVEGAPWFGSGKATEGEDDTSAKNTDVLLEYLNDPSPASCVVFVCDKANKTRKLTKAVQKNGVLAEFVPLKGGAALVWLDDRLDELGLKMSEDVKKQFMFYCDNSCGFADLELKKLVAYAPEGGRVDAALIDELVSRNQAANVFKLIDFVAEAKAEKSLDVLKELLLTENAFTLIPLLSGHFRTMLIVKSMDARGNNTQAMLAATGKNSPFVIEKALRQAGRYTVDQLKRIMEIWLAADVKLKTGVTTSVEEVLETAILQICWLTAGKK